MSLYPIVLGLVAAAAFGVVDFLCPPAVKKVGAMRTLFYYSVLGAVFLLIFSGFTGQLRVSSIPFFELTVICLGGLFGFIAFFRSFRKGKLSVVSPISASWAAVTVITSVILFGERLSPMQTIGVILAVAGTALVSFRYSELRHPGSTRKIYAGVPEAVAAMLIWGVTWAFYKPVVLAMGITLPVIAYLVFIVAAVGITSPLTKTSLSLSKKGALFLIAGIAFFSVAGNAVYNVGMQTEMVSIVAPISSLSPLVSVAMARYLRREKTEFNQNIGILFIAAALVLLAI
ncbi:MAG: EamA family transporter [Candidatus Micrarchaeota archaeon]